MSADGDDVSDGESSVSESSDSEHEVDTQDSLEYTVISGLYSIFPTLGRDRSGSATSFSPLVFQFKGATRQCSFSATTAVVPSPRSFVLLALAATTLVKATGLAHLFVITVCPIEGCISIQLQFLRFIMNNRVGFVQLYIENQQKLNL